MPEAVLHQVHHDPLEAPPVDGEEHGISVEAEELHLGLGPPPCRGHAAKEVEQVGLFPLHVGGVGVEPRDLQQVVYEPAETADVAHHEFGGSAGFGREVVLCARPEAAVEQRGFPNQCRHRGAQLVGDVRREAPFPGFGRLEGGDLGLQGGGHGVERGAERAELIASCGQTDREVAAGDAHRGLAGQRHGTGQPAGEDPAEDHPQQRQHQSCSHQHPAEALQDGLSIALGIEEVGRRTSLPHAGAHGQRGHDCRVVSPDR